MMYISLSEAKAQCRVDHDLDDTDLILKIEAASSMVKNYLKDVSPFEPIRDTSDNPTVDSNDDPVIDDDVIRYEVRAATAILVQNLYDQSLDGRYSIASPGVFLIPEVMAILYPLRTPTIA